MMNVSGIFIGGTHFFFGRARVSKVVDTVSIGKTAGFLPRQTRGITVGSTAAVEPVSVVIAVEAMVEAVEAVEAVKASETWVEAMVEASETRVEASVPVIAVDPIDEVSVPDFAVGASIIPVISVETSVPDIAVEASIVPVISVEASVPDIAVDPIDDVSVPDTAVEFFFAGRQTLRTGGCCDFRLVPPPSPSIYSIFYSII